jgi:hypothetical protein
MAGELPVFAITSRRTWIVDLLKMIDFVTAYPVLVKLTAAVDANPCFFF